MGVDKIVKAAAAGSEGDGVMTDYEFTELNQRGRLARKKCRVSAIAVGVSPKE
jgi:hypothetical protein